MNRNKELILKIVLGWEIGPGRDHANTDKKGDKRTRDGVTQPAYDHWRRSRKLPLQDVFKMLDAERDAIYSDNYWVPVGGPVLPSGVDLIAFDCIVNGSRILKWLADSAHLAPAPRIQYIHAQRLGYWRHCPQWIAAGAGWLNREKDILKKALLLAGGS